MKKAVWLAYDFGFRGDYDGLYAWLDDHDAKECADGLALLKYDVCKSEDIVEKLREDIAENVQLSKRDRIYAIFLGPDRKMKGVFLFGRRKQAPWEGYGAGKAETIDEVEA